MGDLISNNLFRNISFDELYQFSSLIIDLSGNRISGMENLRITQDLIKQYNRGELDDNVKLKEYLSFFVNHHISVNDLAHSMYNVLQQIRKENGQDEFDYILKMDSKIAVMMKYIKVFYNMYPDDSFSIDIENWVYTNSLDSNSLLADLISIFDSYIDKDSFQDIINNIRLLNTDEFVNILSNFGSIKEVVDVIDNKIGANFLGRNYINVDSNFDISLIKDTVIHESIHHLFTSDGKTGFFVLGDETNQYLGLNESVTQYFTNRVMAERYDKVNDNSIYQMGVFCINMLILYDYIKEEELIDCYSRHDVGKFRNILVSNGLFDEQVDQIMVSIEIASRAYRVNGTFPTDNEAKMAADILREILNNSINYDTIKNRHV